MARNNPNITIEFQAKGHKPLIDALQKLNAEQKKLAKAVKATGTNVKSFGQRVDKATDTMKRQGGIVNALNANIAVYRNRILLAAFAVGMYAKTIGRLTTLYTEQELAEKKLSTALGSTSQELLDFASALQQSTTYGDENIIQAMSLAAAFTNNEQALKNLSIVATDFSSATGQDLNTSMNLISKSIFSSTNALSRYGISIDNSLRGTSRFNAVIQSLNEKFAGQAAAQAETYGGAVQQFSNNIGDMGETLGKALAEFLLPFIKSMNELIQSLDPEAIKFAASAFSSLAASIFLTKKRLTGLVALFGATTAATGDTAKKVGFLATALGGLKNAFRIFTKAGLVYGAVSLIGNFAKSFFKAEKSVKATTQVTQDLGFEVRDLTKDMAALVSIHQLEAYASAQGVNQHIYRISVLEDERDVISAQIVALNEKIGAEGTIMQNQKQQIDNLTQQQKMENQGAAIHAIRNKALKEENLAIEEKEGLMQKLYEITDELDFLGAERIKSMESEEEIRKKIRQMEIANITYVANLIPKEMLKNELLQNKLEFMGAELLLEDELSKARARGIKDQDIDIEGLEEQINKTYQLTQAIKQQEATRSAMASQFQSIASAITGFVFTTDIATLKFRDFERTVIQAFNNIIANFLAKYAVFKLMSFMFPRMGLVAPTLFGQTMGGLGNLLAPAAPSYAGAEGGIGLAEQFHNGGMIPQSYHQGGDVPIIAQEGEFVMRRSAVESIGVENLNRMNRTGQASGGINITFSGNVMSDDFVEDVAIPKIKDAIRRGADIGVS
jgi:hypothetical protein